METLLNQGTTLKFNGKDYTVRRLGVMDVFKVARILAKVGKSTFASFAVQEGQKIDPREIGFQIVASIPELENEIMGLLAGLLNISVDEFGKLPPEALIEVIAAVIEGDDIKSFIEAVKKAAEKLMAKIPETPQNN